MIRKLRCQECGLVYDAGRSDSKFCSPRCRQRHRRRKGRSPLVPDLPPEIPSHAPPAECEAAVAAAHRAANDLGRLSSSGPYQLRAALGRIARALSDALEAEGL